MQINKGDTRTPSRQLAKLHEKKKRNSWMWSYKWLINLDNCSTSQIVKEMELTQNMNFLSLSTRKYLKNNNRIWWNVDSYPFTSGRKILKSNLQYVWENFMLVDSALIKWIGKDFFLHTHIHSSDIYNSEVWEQSKCSVVSDRLWYIFTVKLYVL